MKMFFFRETVSSLMARPTDRDHSDQRSETNPRACPLCGEHRPQHQRPRYRVQLEDEALDTQSRIVAGSVCPSCWEALYTAIAEDEAMPIEFSHDAGEY
jgi:hypothetical protein